MAVAKKAKEADEKAGGAKPRPKEEKETKKSEAKPFEFKKDEVYPKHKPYDHTSAPKDDGDFNSLYKSDYKHPKDGHEKGEDIHGYPYDPKTFPTDTKLSLSTLARARSLAQG